MRLFNDETKSWAMVCTLICAGIVFSLFYLGAQPVAVGLFPTPVDKVVHFGMFSLITMLLWMGVLRGRPWTLIVLATAIGALDEYRQLSLPGRSAALDDLAMDVAAILVTTLLLVWLTPAPVGGGQADRG